MEFRNIYDEREPEEGGASVILDLIAIALLVPFFVVILYEGGYKDWEGKVFLVGIAFIWWRVIA